MKFTWLSNSPWSPTGYGNQTKLFLPRFQALGHDPAVIAFYGLEGGALNMNGVMIFPKGRHPYGQDVAAAHTRGHGAQVLFSLIDTWVYNAQAMQEGGIKWCVPAGTLVKMATGKDKPIEQVKAGETVVSEFSPMFEPSYLVQSRVKKVWKIPASESGEIIEIITEGGYRLEVTAENSVAVHTTDGLFAWVEASALTLDDMVYCCNSIPLTEGSKDNAENAQDKQHHNGQDQRLSGEFIASRSGLHGGDYRRGRDNLNSPGIEEGYASYTFPEGVRFQYERTAPGVVVRTIRDESQFQNQAVEQVQERTETGNNAGDLRIPLLQLPEDNRTLLDRKEGIGASSDGVHREPSSEWAGELQQPVHGERTRCLAESALNQPQRIVSIRRVGKPYDYVYDLTTEDGNFFAGGILIHNCPWFPVDMEPLPRPVMQAVAPAYRRIVFSRFGERMVQDAGLDCYYVPHGVDTRAFRPVDRVQARKVAQLPDDKFIVGMVAANKGLPPRKAFFENLAAFAAFHKAHPDTLLYLHTPAGDHPEGTQMANLPEYCTALGLVVGKDVLFPNQYQLMLGFPDQAMNDLYNSFDVHLLVSMGEGFGIPIVEAQASGCPVIVGDWTAMGELCFSGWKVSKKESTPYWTPLAAWQYTPHVGAIAERLEAAYRMSGNDDYRKRARDGALAYDADKVTEKYWKPVLADIEQSLERRAVKL